MEPSFSGAGCEAGGDGVWPGQTCPHCPLPGFRPFFLSSCLCGMGGGSCGDGQALSAWACHCARHCARHLQNVRHTVCTSGGWRDGWMGSKGEGRVGGSGAT